MLLLQVKRFVEMFDGRQIVLNFILRVFVVWYQSICISNLIRYSDMSWLSLQRF